jgi:hypothetical protein
VLLSQSSDTSFIVSRLIPRQECHRAPKVRHLWAGRMQAYCMKCRAKKEIKNPKSIVMKNKRPATQGVCPTCGTKVFRIGK